MTKFFVDAAGKYLGGFDGAEPPAGAIEVPDPPPHGLMKRQGAVWVDTPESTVERNRPPPIDLEKFAEILRVKGFVTPAEINGARQ